jgi:hypothetical protein
MPAFLDRYPTTGLRVQSWIADDPTGDDNDPYVGIACYACTHTHMVNPKTGKVLGEDDE